MCSTGVTIYAIDVSLESSLGLVPADHAVDASLESSQVLVVTSTPSSKAKRHAIDEKREAKSSDAAGRTTARSGYSPCESFSTRGAWPRVPPVRIRRSSAASCHAEKVVVVRRHGDLAALNRDPHPATVAALVLK